MWFSKWFVVYFCISGALASSINKTLSKTKNKLKYKHNKYTHDKPEQKNVSKYRKSTSKFKDLKMPDVNSYIYINWPKWLPTYDGEYRNIKPEWNKGGDCLFESRKAPRPYPNDCYAHSKYSEETFHAFWQTIRGILSFTFDTVLWSKNDNNNVNVKRTNQFWFLIAYLKEIAIKFQSPDQIGALRTREFEFGQIDSLISEHYEGITKHSLHAQDQQKYLLQLNEKQSPILRVWDENIFKEPVESLNTSKKQSHKKEEKIESDFVWKKTCLKNAYKLSDKAVVIGQDYDGIPLWVIRAQMEDSDLNIGKFNLNNSFASVPNEGNEVIVNDDFEVLCKKNENAIKWVKYNISDPWPKNAVLAGEIGMSTKMYVGRIKQDGHFIPGKVIKEVLYVPYQGQEYRYSDDYEVLVESGGDSKKPINKYVNDSDPAFIWKKTCIKHAHRLKDRAVVGGKDRDGVSLWVIRAQLEDDDLTLGKFNPNRNIASVPKDGNEVLVHDYFDVLCKKKKNALLWKTYKISETWPAYAVLGGEMENSTKIYVGRVKQDGFHIPGKIINKVLYVAYQGHEHQYLEDFEVLVESKGDFKKPSNKNEHSSGPAFIWKKTCLKHAHKLRDKAVVGGKDHDGTPLWVIRAQLDDDNLALGKFNPNRTYASVPKEGVDVMLSNNFDVLCKKKNDALDWIKYKKSDIWPVNALIAGELENTTKMYVGRVEYDGLDTPGKIINKVLYIAYQGREHQYNDDYEVLVESLEDSKKPSNKQEIKSETAFIWKKTCLSKANSLSDKAVVGGHDHEGIPLWIIRAQVEDDLTLGVFNPNRTYACVPKEGHEILVHDNFDLLCQEKKNALIWLNYKKSDPWPNDAILAGEKENPMYVGRFKQEGHYVPGKIIDQMLYIAYQGLEYKYDEGYEVLVENATSQKPVPTENNVENSESLVSWKNTKPEDSHVLSEEAIVGGEDLSGNPVWIVRSHKNNVLNVGKFNPNNSYATAANDGTEILLDGNFDVLCEKKRDAVTWLMHSNANNPIPKYAVVAGKMENSENMYVGRYNMDGHYTPGKIIDKVLYIAYQGIEFRYNDTFEILVEARIQNTTSRNLTRTTTKKPKQIKEDTTGDDDDDEDLYSDEYFQSV